MSQVPKAFISHASEDKARFVRDFGRHLRERGIDAWVDHWEIQAGDSLVEKIFEEGIKNADAFIIVVSSVSVQKKWVREELDSGMVRKIEKSCRLIPVIIDECEVPNALKHLKWVKVRNLADYAPELSEIVSAIFGTSDKPPIGSPPAHVTATAIDFLPELTKADNMVFGVLCRYYLKKGDHFFQTAEVYDDLMQLGLSENEVEESLQVLAGRGYIHTETIQGTEIWGVKLYPFSLDAFMRVEVNAYDTMLGTVISKIVNEDQIANTTIQASTGIPTPIVLHILDLLDEKGLIEVTGPAGFPFRTIVKVSPELKRILR